MIGFLMDENEKMRKLVMELLGLFEAGISERKPHRG